MVKKAENALFRNGTQNEGMPRFKTFDELKNSLEPKFREKFFGEETTSFFRDEEYFWSEATQGLTIVHSTKRVSSFVPFMTEDGELKLRVYFINRGAS